MTRNAIFNLARGATRQLSMPSSTITRSSLLQSTRPIIFRYTPIASIRACRLFSTTPAASKGISPESEDPQPKAPESSNNAAQPAELTNEEYNELADAYMDAMVERMEQLQEESDEVDVEYSVSSPPSSLVATGYSPWIKTNSYTGWRSQLRLSPNWHICHQ